MKSKLLVFVFLVTICVMSFSSCNIFGFAQSSDPDGFIYDKDSELVLVYADDGLPTDVKNSIYVTSVKCTIHILTNYYGVYYSSIFF